MGDVRTALEVMSCIADNCSGTLCLDVDSGPKWQIDCNVCGDLRMTKHTVFFSRLPARGLQQLAIFEDKARGLGV